MGSRNDRPEVVAALIPLGDAAKILGVSTSAAHDMIKRGDFPLRHYRVGRRFKVSRAELDAYLAGVKP